METRFEEITRKSLAEDILIDLTGIIEEGHYNSLNPRNFDYSQVDV